MADRELTQYRPGDLVEVRSAAEILETLDGDGSYEGLPFMAEMLPYLGKRLSVAVAIQKVCWYTPESSSRRLPGTVILEQLRCTGEAHGGCQAECRLYWKEAWLRPVDPSNPPRTTPTSNGDHDFAALAQFVREKTRTHRSFDGADEEVYRCQYTDVVNASTPLGELEPSQYLGELRSGNIGLVRFAKVFVRASGWRVSRRLLRRTPEMPTLAGENRVDGEKLNLQVGELVEVQSLDEIGLTLDAGARHRGLTFTEELTPRCGKQFRVRSRVERLIDRETGRMIELKNDCVTLESVVCSGDRTPGSWFCPSEHYTLWREAWLRRVETSVDA